MEKSTETVMEAAPVYLRRKMRTWTSIEQARKESVAERLRMAKELAAEEDVTVQDALMAMAAYELWLQR